MKIILTAAVTCCAAAMTLAPATAQAAADPVPTTVNFHEGFTYDEDTEMVTVKGRVASEAGRCKRNRKVVVTATDHNIRAGSDRTNDKGFWRVTFAGSDVNPGDGNFKAVAPQVTVNGVTCARGRDTRNIFENMP